MVISREPTYITNPLDVSVHEFQPHLPLTTNNRDVTIHFDGYAEQPVDLAELDIQTIRTIGGASVEAALLASPDNDGTLKTVLMGWGGNFRSDIALLEIAEIARQNTGSDLLVVNNPGSGDSSTIPKAAMKEMKRTGSFIPYGELVAETVNRYLQDYDRVNSYGHSMGARSTIAAAPLFDKRVDYAAITDPPGSRKLGLLGVGNAFMMIEGGHAGKYAELSDNELSLRLQKENDANALTNMRKMGLKGVKQMFLDQSAAMGQDGLRTDLQTLAESRNIDALQINSPEFSALNKPQDMAKILDELIVHYPHLRVLQAVLLGQTHSVNVGGNSHTTGALSKLL